MSKGSAPTYSMKFQARVLQPNISERNQSQWLVGSTCLREENELRVLEYDAAQETLRSVQLWVHPEEMWDVAANPASTSSFVTVHSQAGVYGATLWCGEAGSQMLQCQAKLQHEGVIRRALWHGQNTGVLVTVEEAAIRKWQVSDHSAQCVATASPGPEQRLWSATLHPKRPDMAATAAGDSVQLWDINNMTKTGEIPGAHGMAVRDVDFATQNEHRLVTAGDDCKLRFWDLRMLDKHVALLELGGHSHWVWRARYNPHHDELLLSSSSDASVSLWYTPALTKASTAAASPVTPSRSPKQGSHRRPVDGRVQSYDEHEDSVYGVAWSLADPWLFASLSYDGRVVINTVPKNIKYKVLI